MPFLNVFLTSMLVRTQWQDFCSANTALLAFLLHWLPILASGLSRVMEVDHTLLVSAAPPSHDVSHTGYKCYS